MGIVTDKTIVLSSDEQTVSYYAWLSHIKKQRSKKTTQYNYADPKIEGKLEYKWEKGNGADWLTITPIDKKRINITVSENNNESDRSVKLYLTGVTDAGSQKVSLTIKQEATEHIPTLKLYLDGQETKPKGTVKYGQTGLVKAKLDGVEIDINEVTLGYVDAEWYNHNNEKVSNINSWTETDDYDIIDRLFSVYDDTKSYNDGDTFYLFSRDEEKEEKPTDFYWDLSYTKKQAETKNTVVTGTYTTSTGKVLTAQLSIDFIGEKPIGRYFGDNNKDNYSTESENTERLNIAVPAYEGNYNGIYRFSTDKCNETGDVRIKANMIGRTFFHTVKIAAPDGVYIRDFVFKAADDNNVFRFDVDKINATSVNLIEPTYRIYVDGEEQKGAKATISITEGSDWVVSRTESANNGRYYIKFNESLTNDRTMVATATYMGAKATTTITQDRNKPFEIKVKVPSNGEIGLYPKIRGAVANGYEEATNGKCVIEWGDGNSDTRSSSRTGTNYDTWDATHKYTNGGEYTIKIYQITRGHVNAGGGASYRIVKNGGQYVTEVINGVPIMMVSAYSMSGLTNLTYVGFDKLRKMFAEMNIFSGNNNLKELVIPKYCWSMGFTSYSEQRGDVFKGSGINTLIMEGYQPPLIDIANNPNMLNSIETILVPPASLRLYRNFDGWKTIADKIKPNESYTEMMAAFNL